MNADLERIKNTKTIDEASALYDVVVSSRMRELYAMVGRRDFQQFAKEWANSNDDAHTKAHEHRKVALTLLYRAVDLCTGDDNKFDADAFKSSFGEERAANIVQICLPMDRAYALYKMRLPSGKIGMHWFSKTQKELTTEFDGYEGFATQNKRFQWLVDGGILNNVAIRKALEWQLAE